MITRIGIENFKSLQSVDLKLGNFNLFIGANASGKSNFFDALRVLQGIGYGFTIDEIFNGKPKSETSEVWEGIRGGSGKAAFLGKGREGPDSSEEDIRFSASAILPKRMSMLRVSYSIGIDPLDGCVRSEGLKEENGRPIYDSNPVKNQPDSPGFKVRYYKDRTGRQPEAVFDRARPVLSQLSSYDDRNIGDSILTDVCCATFGNMQRLNPSPSILREYATAQHIRRMGERGENFATLVKAILADPKTSSAYLSWLQRLTPMDFDDIEVINGPLGESLFAVRERGDTYPAPILSDGTLRFAAIAAAFFQPDLPGRLTIEEIGNSIHPSRLRLLVELLKSQAKVDVQVFATTHSPLVLNWLKEEDYETTFLCKRDEETGASSITPLSRIPRFLEVVKKHSVAELFAMEWLETAI